MTDLDDGIYWNGPRRALVHYPPDKRTDAFHVECVNPKKELLVIRAANTLIFRTREPQ